MDEKLLEPLKYYNEVLKNKHKENINAYFDDLVTRSEVDVEANRELAKKYHKKVDDINVFVDKLKKFKSYKSFTIIGIIIGVLVLLYGIYVLFAKTANEQVIIVLPGGFIVAGLCFYFLIIKINPNLKDFDVAKKRLESEVAKLQEEGYQQLDSLNRLYDSDDVRQLIMKTFPDVVIDKNFDMKRFEYLNSKYGLGDNDDVNISSLKILSGEIVGNPYVVVKTLSHYLGEQKYTGSKTISWNTTYTDSEGNIKTEHHSQTLHASVTKPKPFYNIYTSLIYGNEAAPSLSFSRAPGHVEKLNQKEYEKYIKDGSKKIQKLADKAIKNAGHFTPLGNDEFDVVFNALDRDNEAEFRLLFTPLAQNNLLDIMRNSDYGDDFYFTKEKKINRITSEHTITWDLDSWCEHFYNFDIDDAKERFSEFHNQYFKHLFFELVPLLAIPLYQQNKPSEYIYKHDYKRNYTSYITEVLANALGDEHFAPYNAKTESIIKTKYITSDGKTDNVEITAYAYDTEEHVDYIPVHGGDGRYHDVPVEWTKYIPITRTSEMNLKDIDVNNQFYLGMQKEDNFKYYLSKYNISAYSYDNGMFAMKLDNNQVDGLDKDLDNLISAIKSMIKEEK